MTDFDGTMTKRDFYQLALDRFLPTGTEEIWQHYLAKKITHFDALQAMFLTIRASKKEVLKAVYAMRIDAKAADSVKLLTKSGWGVFVASAGCAWYISILLESLGIRWTTVSPWDRPPTDGKVTLLANPGTYIRGKGLHMKRPRTSPFKTANTGTDKVAATKATIKRVPMVAFAGDGPPDLAPALLVPPRLRFAKGWLAAHLQSKKIPFRSFDNWSEIAHRLTEEKSPQ